MVILDYYKSLRKTEKKRFRLQVMLATELAEATIHYKMRDDSFSKLEREAVEKIIKDFQRDEKN